MKHLTDIMIDTYIISPTKKIVRQVDNHVQECSECREKLEMAKTMLNDPEIENQAAQTISDEDVEKILKKLEPTHAWKPKENTFVNKVIAQLMSIYELLAHFFSELCLAIYEFFFPPELAHVRLRLTREEKNLPIKRFGLGFLMLRNQIICKQLFSNLELKMQFNRIRKGKVNMVIELTNPSNRNVRASITGSEIGNMSEIIDHECRFNDLPFDTYCLVVKQFSEFKGKYIFSIRKEGIYEQTTF